MAPEISHRINIIIQHQNPDPRIQPQTSAPNFSTKIQQQNSAPQLSTTTQHQYSASKLSTRIQHRLCHGSALVRPWLGPRSALDRVLLGPRSALGGSWFGLGSALSCLLLGISLAPVPDRPGSTRLGPSSASVRPRFWPRQWP